MEERRRFPRLQVELIVRYKILETSEQHCEATTKDISAGGVCLITREQLKAGSSLAVDIKLPQQTEPVMAVGRVVWSNVSRLGLSPGGHQRYDNGIEFVEIKDKDRQRIIKKVKADLDKAQAEGWKIGLARDLPETK